MLSKTCTFLTINPGTELRFSDGSIPFDESLFDDVTSVTPLEDDHIPTHSEEIVNELLKRKAERKGKRIRPKKEKKVNKPTNTVVVKIFILLETVCFKSLTEV